MDHYRATKMNNYVPIILIFGNRNILTTLMMAEKLTNHFLSDQDGSDGWLT